LLSPDNPHINIGNIQIELTTDDHDEDEEEDNGGQARSTFNDSVSVFSGDALLTRSQFRRPGYSNYLHRAVYSIFSTPTDGQPIRPRKTTTTKTILTTTFLHSDID
jgi:hypothetical protein